MIVFGLLSSGCSSTTVEEPAVSPASRSESAPSDDDGAAEEPPVNTLKWTTASEVENFGFDIYRSFSEDGPFDRITAEPIPGAGTTDEPQSYVWVDAEIDPSEDYYYYIESISLGGVREKFSPVIRSPAKRSLQETN
jgi:hypothetical protein